MRSPEYSAPPKVARARSITFYAKWLETPLGAMLALANDEDHLLEFVDRRGLEREILALRRRVGITSFRASIAISTRSARSSMPTSPDDRWYSRRRCARGFAVQLSTVWNALLAIPRVRRDRTPTLPRRFDTPAAVRAVSRANRRQQAGGRRACHRVVGADGTLTGYGGGLWRKAWLLEHERTHAGHGQSTLPGIEKHRVVDAIGA
jgi:AraC family transcriptional regulator of adaptative response/methylated-DNA-[protein]-cysteine methyltransferase